MMSKKHALLLPFFIALLALASCGNKPKVDALKLATGSVESTVTTINSGTVEAQSQAELAFGTVGRIAKIYVALGSKVNAGAIIAELENADLKAVYNETQMDLSRTNELYKNGLVSIANLESAKRAREVARLNYEKTVMKAPFEGMITAMDLKIGEYYQSATTLDKKPAVQIIDLKKRLIKGEIDEVDLQKVAIGYLARVKIPALKNQIVKAKVTKVVPFVSTAKDQDRTSQIELEILEAKDEKGKNILIPVGASADVEIISEAKNNVKILPTNVLTGTGKTRSLYKIVKGKLVKSKVLLGLGNYERVEILEGLAPNELVARPLSGEELTDGMKVEAVEKAWP
ncbi:MAG: efflux RND transporter periplasmic adaptor subunit [Bacteriovorax sp.]